ncbi:MAG: methyltransferase [Methanoregula sp.]|jgi:tRNA (guanine37-N1)-methyltransferase
MVEQWCIRVPANRGEELRLALIEEGVLDLSLKVRRDGSLLFFPVTERREGAVRDDFESQPGRLVLPRHELVGGIAIMQNHDPAGAAKILASRPSLHTVLCAASDVSGEYRTRKFAVLAGLPTTRTQVIEYGHRFIVDLSTAYFSARLSSERQRILSRMGDDETVLDMFAGVGPFAITLAVRALLIVASDINPDAILLMLANLAQNRTKNVLPVLADAHHLPARMPCRFNRIVMNLPLSGTAFLPDAFLLCKPGGIIHFYSLVSKEGEHLSAISELGGTTVSERIVRSYSPSQWHAVYDIVVGKN